MRAIAADEKMPVKDLLRYCAAGKIVIPANNTHHIKKPCGIGYRMRTKVNANIGTSTEKSRLVLEIKKLDAAIECGADTIMDLSVGGDIRRIRQQIMKHSPVPVGTVPVYEIAVRAKARTGDFLSFTGPDVLDVLTDQAKDGVDFFTIHSGVTRKSIAVLRRQPRIMDIVSRGGAILAGWMHRHKKENPFFENFDKIIDIAHTYDVTLSLGDALRPGSILDATDAAQVSELSILGKLAERARKRGVQVMIEGPGHVPLPQIRENMELQKKMCNGAPFYVLGPLVTDVASGYDHIAGAIGGALAAWYGADFLCYVTPAEHLRLPSVEDVREGVIASKIAGHAADLAKGIPGALQWDEAMSRARKARDWKEQVRLSIDPVKARRYHGSAQSHKDDVCSMCGDYCSIKLMGECSPLKKNAGTGRSGE